MPVTNQTLYGVINVNGGADIHLGRHPFPELVKRLMLWARDQETKGFSSGNLQFSVTELKREIKETSAFDITAHLLSLTGPLQPMNAEEQADYDSREHKRNHPLYNTWARASSKSAHSFRESLAPDEWARIKQTARELWPDEYEERKHWFGG